MQFPRATRLVICCRGSADEAMAVMRSMMERLKLTVNETKTRVCHVPHESFDFLGYTLGRCYSPRTGRAYIGTRPSRKKVERLCREISELTGRHQTLWDVETQVDRINRRLIGWANYFRLGPVSKAYRLIQHHTLYRLRQWLCRKHGVQERKYMHFPDPYLHDELGLVRLTERTRNFAWAKA